MTDAVTAVVTLSTSSRLEHLRLQLEALACQAVFTIVVWLDDDEPPALDADRVVGVPPAVGGLRLATARNVGADVAVDAGAELIVFLDADCVPGLDLIDLYAAASKAHPEAVLCGPVTYLEPGVDPRDAGALARATAPHSARPAPPAGTTVVAGDDDYRLFWSLSFAVSAATWRNAPRFDVRFVGYGGEDTDFAFRLRESETPLVWVGGAHAYHQYHPTSAPPVQHLDDILRNGALFASTWGEWPMTGWLEQFEASGLIRRRGAGWTRVTQPVR